jgi:acetamidase/formamidase
VGAGVSVGDGHAAQGVRGGLARPTTRHRSATTT